jgi:hypothetical protein
MSHDEHPVLGDDDVGLDRIHAHLEREIVGGAAVLGAVSGRASVADDQRRTTRHAFSVIAASLGQIPAGATGRSGIVDSQHIAVTP